MDTTLKQLVLSNVNNRYKIDERCGCAAIVDTFWPNESNGLNSDSVHVIKYINLVQPERPTHDMTSEQIASQRSYQLGMLKEECEMLNMTNMVSLKECQEAREEFEKASARLIKLFPKIYRISV